MDRSERQDQIKRLASIFSAPLTPRPGFAVHLSLSYSEVQLCAEAFRVLEEKEETYRLHVRPPELMAHRGQEWDLTSVIDPEQILRVTTVNGDVLYGPIDAFDWSYDHPLTDTIINAKVVEEPGPLTVIRGKRPAKYLEPGATWPIEAVLDPATVVLVKGYGKQGYRDVHRVREVSWDGFFTPEQKAPTRYCIESFVVVENVKRKGTK